ncbi:unnamed protein product [Trifolium pratense]|uniref:Uncharacterized protein n=1 Tax=Trifolium pratense TaxID=57577 RepID=A0ACB0LAD8_TRIPR|nr:unnamed protein product [Trifolium pratense]
MLWKLMVALMVTGEDVGEAFKMRWSPPLFYPLVGEIYVSPPRERVRVKRLWWEKQQADKK